MSFSLERLANSLTTPELQHTFWLIAFALQRTHEAQLTQPELTALIGLLLQSQAAEKALTEREVAATGQPVLALARKAIDNGDRVDEAKLKPVVLKTSDQIDQLPQETLLVHLSCQAVMSTEVLRSLRRHCPFLQRITYPPSLKEWFNREMGRFADQAGIEYGSFRTVKPPAEKKAIGLAEFREKQQLFQAVWEVVAEQPESPLAAFAAEMEALPAIEFQLGRLYLANPEHVSMAELAAVTGFRIQFIQTKLSTYCRWLESVIEGTWTQDPLTRDYQTNRSSHQKWGLLAARRAAQRLSSQTSHQVAERR